MTDDDEKNRGGHPTSYRPEFAADARPLCENGFTDPDLALAFGVCERTIRTWRAKHPEFKEACKVGKEAADDRVEASLYQRAVGYQYEATKVFFDREATGDQRIVYARYIEHVIPDTKAAEIWLNNRQPQKWRIRQHHEVSGPDGGPIKTEGSLTDLEAARLIARVLLQGGKAEDAPEDPPAKDGTPPDADDDPGTESA